MRTVLGAALFWTTIVSAVVAQVMILRSTRRALRGIEGQHARPLEWVFAIVPAIAVMFLLYLTWRAATVPPVLQVEFPPSGAEIGS